MNFYGRLRIIQTEVETGNKLQRVQPDGRTYKFLENKEVLDMGAASDVLPSTRS